MRTQTIMESPNDIIDDFKDFAEFSIEEKITKFIENEEKSKSSDGRILTVKGSNQPNSKDQKSTD